MTIYGSDVSHYDLPNTIAMIREGIVFQTHKAGGDSNAGDTELDDWWAYVKGTDPDEVLLGTYWVPRPDLYGNPTSEADRWLGVLNRSCPGWTGREHILQIDAEKWPAGAKTKPNRAYIQTLANRLMAKMPKLRPLCYASKGQYGDELRGLTIPLWNARYPLPNTTGDFKSLYARMGGDKGGGWQTYSGQMPVIWQYSSTATIGGQTTSDANAFRGTLAQLKALVAPGWAAPTEGEDVELTDKVGSKAWPSRDLQDFILDLHGLRDVLKGDQTGTKAAGYAPDSPLLELLGIPARVASIEAKLDKIIDALPTS
ncbi:hypothetical protein HH310_12615 [Actinoplanes sp. TBRC 11911]|uniref:hypothetical protein n=1 Tax=Actinoplanes sp. TBRC 11911 TaxID=2729386 RepID=UPI00145DB6A4|nr:hypothetical protein [Actinoplanes sp. TBRC 11911]NMO52036.1 hypothetical protein [Actinoplanes sp. TBRC 11911]